MNRGLSALLILFASCLSPMSASTLQVYFGTYTPAGGASRGIYSATLDLATGALSAPALAAVASNPTFLTLRPDGRALYALAESGTVDGKPGGALASFRVDAATGALTPLNVAATGGGPLAHVNVDPSGRMAAVISYHASQVAAFPLAADGRLGACTGLVTHTGRLGPNAKRQDKPHPHSITYSPDGRFLYVCDLGLDRIAAYRYDASTATLAHASDTATAPGDGPRHSKISADGRFLYAINELASSLTTYAIDAASGALRPLQSLSTLPASFNGESICAEIRLGAGERFVYGSNRGHDSLAVFARDAATGTLALVEIVPCGGKHPRNFALTPDGRWLLCASRDTNNVVAFRVDPQSGRLTPAGHEITVPQAVCVLFAPSA